VRTVYDLMVQTAFKLAGKPVRVRFQHNEGLKGVCRKDNSGITVIDIEPELQFFSEQEFLRVFLHECSHALNDNFIPMELEVSDRIPVAETIIYNLKETRADKQAKEWLQFAEENRNLQLPYFEGCLWSLISSTF